VECHLGVNSSTGGAISRKLPESQYHLATTETAPKTDFENLVPIP
jgi:hypothetical protein